MGYGWYVMHQPVIVAVAFVVVRWRASIPTELAVLLIVSLGGTLAAAELLQRTPFVRQLFGFHSNASGGRRVSGAVPQ
jgi:peptidoglycan/LPS O-acetylase OafA/YrhL